MHIGRHRPLSLLGINFNFSSLLAEMEIGTKGKKPKHYNYDDIGANEEVIK
jgi:hypothetical protein